MVDASSLWRTSRTVVVGRAPGATLAAEARDPDPGLLAPGRLPDPDPGAQSLAPNPSHRHVRGPGPPSPSRNPNRDLAADPRSNGASPSLVPEAGARVKRRPERLSLAPSLNLDQRLLLAVMVNGQLLRRMMIKSKSSGLIFLTFLLCSHFIVSIKCFCCFFVFFSGKIQLIFLEGLRKEALFF
jgi:hypothetical protein